MKIQDILVYTLILVIGAQLLVIYLVKKQDRQYVPQMCMSRYLYDGQGNPIACRK